MKTLIDLIKEISSPKNQWFPITKSELMDYEDDVFDLIQNAYAYIGGHANYKNPKDLSLSGEDFEAIDVDNDPDIDAVSISKKRPYGNKLVATGHDGSKDAKRAVIKRRIDKLKSQGYYIEVSGKLQDILLSKGVAPITDEELVRNILKGKDIKWNGDGTYERILGGTSHTKMMLGKPNI